MPNLPLFISQESLELQNRTPNPHTIVAILPTYVKNKRLCPSLPNGWAVLGSECYRGYLTDGKPCEDLRGLHSGGEGCTTRHYHLITGDYEPPRDSPKPLNIPSKLQRQDTTYFLAASQ